MVHDAELILVAGALLGVGVAASLSMSGVFAAGDVRQDSIKRVASAVGEGATVVRVAHEHLRTDEPERAPRSAMGV